MNIVLIIFSIVILIVSVMFHELAHGTVADKLGDPTPSLAGRLTLNPLAHLDLIGSIVLPVACIVLGGGLIIGWAKPVPFNPNYFSNKRFGPASVAIAGPLANIIIAIVAAAVFRFSPHDGAFAQILRMVASINVALAVFNLVPIPPLDGHHILGSLIPPFKRWSDRIIGAYGIVLLVVAIVIAGSVIGPVAEFFTRILLGL